MSYSTGKIYCIRNKINDDVYVGSTTISLAKRMAKHRWSCKNQPHRKLYELMGELGIDNFYIELIEDCPCDNKEHHCLFSLTFWSFACVPLTETLLKMGALCVSRSCSCCRLILFSQALVSA